MKITNILKTKVPSALTGQEDVPNVYAHSTFKKTKQLPKKKKSVYGMPQSGGALGGAPGGGCAAGAAGGGGGH